MPLYGTFDSRDIVADFDPILEQAMENLWAANVSYLNFDSSREVEEYNWLGSSPQLQEWIGGRSERQLNEYSLEVRNTKYESTLPIDLDDLRRDKTGQLRSRVAGLAQRTATHWNKILSPLIDTGTAGTNGLAYDGQFFYDTDHNESGTNQTNDLTATQVPSANVADAAAPTADEFAKIIVETHGYMESYTDDEGEPINQDINGMVVMVSKPSYAAAARQAVGLDNLTSGATNPVNGLPFAKNAISVIQNTRLTDANAIHFMITGGNADNPFILQQDGGVQTQLLGPGSDEEFNNDRHVFGVKAIRGTAYGRWQRAAFVALS